MANEKEMPNEMIAWLKAGKSLKAVRSRMLSKTKEHYLVSNIPCIEIAISKEKPDMEERNLLLRTPLLEGGESSLQPCTFH